MLFNSIGCFVQSRPIALPHFNILETFFLYIVSSQCIELSLFAITLNILISERSTQLLTGAEEVKASHGFKDSVAMKTKPINTEAVNFLLFACCKEAFNFTIWPCSLEISKNIFSKLRVSFCRGTNLRVSKSKSLRV